MSEEAFSKKELTILAARARGLEERNGCWDEFRNCYSYCTEGCGVFKTEWNPLKRDYQAFDLAVHLGIHIFSPDLPEYHNGGDVHAAVRREIVKAAAEIGRNIK